MVPMSDNETLGLERTIGSVLVNLHSIRDEAFTWPSPNSGFALFVLRQANIEPSTVMVESMSADCMLQPNSPLLAALGYRIGVDNQFASRVKDEWLGAIDRLAQRDPFPADRQSFGFRPIELLGITLGLFQVGDSSKKEWIQGVLATANAAASSDAWTQMLLAIASHHAGLSISLGSGFTGLSASELGLRRWLAESRVAGVELRPELDEALLCACIIGTLDADECARATILAVSLEAAVRRSVATCIGANWLADRSRVESESVVIQVCRRFHFAARQLRTRYGGRSPIELKDEYDVQDLLKTLLAVHFDDIRPEEYTPSYGGKSTRMDFLLKSVGIVVEAKMTRVGLADKDVSSQLIDDKERYRAHPECKSLICLIYDPEGYIKNAKGLEDDLSQDEGGLRTRVIVNPTGM